MAIRRRLRNVAALVLAGVAGVTLTVLVREQERPGQETYPASRYERPAWHRARHFKVGNILATSSIADAAAAKSAFHDVLCPAPGDADAGDQQETDCRTLTYPDLFEDGWCRTSDGVEILRWATFAVSQAQSVALTRLCAREAFCDARMLRPDSGTDMAEEMAALGVEVCE